MEKHIEAVKFLIESVCENPNYDVPPGLYWAAKTTIDALCKEKTKLQALIAQENEE